jgi:hypothetical protein
MLRFVITVAVNICILASLYASAQEGSSRAGLLKPLLEVLDNAKISASLEFSGRCTSLDTTEFPEFPTMRSVVAKTPLQTVREMFADHSEFDVTQWPARYFVPSGMLV